jgi:hypothetical protein
MFDIIRLRSKFEHANKRLFRYLQGCKNIGVTFRCKRSENLKLNLIAYSDADYERR